MTQEESWVDKVKGMKTVSTMDIEIDMASGKDKGFSVGWGLAIGLSDEYIQQIRSISQEGYDHSAEVVIRVEDVQKEFALDDFLSLLGFGAGE